jgi:hypothetical protein
MITNDSTIPYTADTLKESFQFDEKWFLQDEEIRNILEKHSMPAGLITWYLNAQERMKNKDTSPFGHFHMGWIDLVWFLHHLDRWVDTRDIVPSDLQREIKSCEYSSLPQLSDQLLVWYDEIWKHVVAFRKQVPSDRLKVAGIKTQVHGKSTEETISLYKTKEWAVSTLLQHAESLKQLAWMMKYTSEGINQYIYHINSMINELNQTFKIDIMQLLAQENNSKDTNK